VHSLNARKTIRDKMQQPSYALPTLDLSAAGGSSGGGTRSHNGPLVFATASDITHVHKNERSVASLDDKLKSETLSVV
jgi:hypothetical protein